MFSSLVQYASNFKLRRQYRRLSLAHIEARIPAIQMALNSVSTGYTLLLGDSHAELLGELGLGDYPLVNAGIGGLSSRGCAIVLPRLRMTTRASTAILSTGSNDIMARANPCSKITCDEFEEAIKIIFEWLHLYADAVIVLSIPPIEQLPYALREPKAVHEYSTRLNRLAKKHNFVFIDPYINLRDSNTGLARTGALKDGVHLRDYTIVASSLLPIINRGPIL